LEKRSSIKTGGKSSISRFREGEITPSAGMMIKKKEGLAPKTSMKQMALWHQKKDSWLHLLDLEKNKKRPRLSYRRYIGLKKKKKNLLL